MVDLPTAIGLISTVLIGLGVVAMLCLVYVGYKQDREVDLHEKEQKKQAAA